jgi:hypothetical protein
MATPNFRNAGLTILAGMQDAWTAGFPQAELAKN